MSQNSILLNRNLQASWMYEALHLASVDADSTSVNELLTNLMRESITGSESIRKSLRYLKATWLSPKTDLVDLRNRGVKVYKGLDGKSYQSGLCYFMLMAAYPFVRQVSEICGRLIRLQGTVKMEQIKRRVAESLGDNENSLRSTRYVVASLYSLGILDSPVKGSYTKQDAQYSLTPGFSAFCLEALLRSYGNAKAIRRVELETHRALFAFKGADLIDMALNDERFVISRESINDELVSLR